MHALQRTHRSRSSASYPFPTRRSARQLLLDSRVQEGLAGRDDGIASSQLPPLRPTNPEPV